MGDQQDRRPLVLAQGPEQLRHLGLHGHVQGARRLVRQQQLRAQRHREGDDHALRLATAELVRVPLQERRIQADGVQGVVQAGLPLGARNVVQRERPVQPDARLQRRGERRAGGLGHEGDASPAEVAQQPPLGTVGPHELHAVEADGAGHTRVRRLQPDHRGEDHGLARAGLAHEAHDLAPSHGQLRDVHEAPPADLHGQVADPQQRAAHGRACAFGSSRSRSPSPRSVNARAAIMIAAPG